MNNFFKKFWHDFIDLSLFISVIGLVSSVAVGVVLIIIASIQYSLVCFLLILPLMVYAVLVKQLVIFLVDKHFELRD